MDRQQNQCEAPKPQAGSATTLSNQDYQFNDNQKNEFDQKYLTDTSGMIDFTEDQFNKLKSSRKFFGVTICPCSTRYKTEAQRDPQMLVRFALKMANSCKLKISALHFEYKTEKKLGRYPHIHFTCHKADTHWNYYSYGMHIYQEPIFHYQGWLSYCKKDELKEEYSFIDTQTP